MRLPGRATQRFAVALLMATLLGPVGGGLAGYPMGMGMDSSPAGGHTTTIEEATRQHAAKVDRSTHHEMGGNDCGEPDSGESHRCAGLWSTACCDYFAPGARVKIEPAPESSSHTSDALPVGAVAETLEPAATWGHLILPIAGGGRAGPTPLIILHSSLLL